MKSLKKLALTSATLILSLLLTSCDGLSLSFPPLIYSNLAKYAVDDGSNVDFTVTVLYNPTSVTCFDTNAVTMANSGTNTWSGTASYTNNLPVKSGSNPVSCTATNANGSTTTAVGFIALIPDVPPDLVMLPTQSICGNDGSKNFNEPLVDFVSTTNVMGAVYQLTAGSLPAGLSINSTNGNLVGTSAAGNFTATPLVMTATTVAGADDSATFTIQINQAACP